MDLELCMWAIAGGLFVAALSSGIIYYNKDTPSNKQMLRDFLFGTAATGFLYPLIPESFDDIKILFKTTANEIKTTITSGDLSLTTLGDPGVKIGPPNF